MHEQEQQQLIDQDISNPNDYKNDNGNSGAAKPYDKGNSGQARPGN